MNRVKLTKRVVQSAKPGKIDLVLWDRLVIGFGYKITPKGKRFWGVDRIEWAIRYGYVPGTVTGP